MRHHRSLRSGQYQAVIHNRGQERSDEDAGYDPAEATEGDAPVGHIRATRPNHLRGCAGAGVHGWIQQLWRRPREWPCVVIPTVCAARSPAERPGYGTDARVTEPDLPAGPNAMPCRRA
jgi:hypothetical protein